MLRSELDTKARCFPVSSTCPDWDALRALLMSMGLLSKFAGLTPRLSARSFRRGGVLLYASVAAHPAPMATAARLHGLVWRVRYVARNMLDRSTSVVHAWTEQGGIERPKRRFGQATGDANDERSGCCAWFESWRELGKWRCYCIVKGLMARTPWRSNPTCRVYTSSPLPEWKWLRRLARRRDVEYIPTSCRHVRRVVR